MCKAYFKITVLLATKGEQMKKTKNLLMVPTTHLPLPSFHKYENNPKEQKTHLSANLGVAHPCCL